MTTIVIIGGVAGGASAAARARRLSEKANIILIERGPHISFANCGLPYHIGGDIAKESALLLQTPSSFKARFNVDVRVNQEALAISPHSQSITIKNNSNGEIYQLHYDKLLLSPGAAPVIPPIAGALNPLTFTLRNIPDMEAILHTLQTHKISHVTVCGAGFIGMEVVEALHQRGLKVALVELSSQVMPNLDAEMAAYLKPHLQEKGIELHLNQGIEKIEYQESSEQVPSLNLHLSHEQTIHTHMLIMAIGMRPEIHLAQDAGLEIGVNGGIKVNSRMQTSDPHIYAVGDAIEVKEWVTNNRIRNTMAGPANRQGRIAADNMLGRHSHYTRSQNTAICRIFDLTAASCGLNEKQLQRQKIDYEKVYLHAADHASYYPGAEMIHLKLLFSHEDGRILGAQAVGKKGIDKRIDILAVAQRANMSVYDLQHVELCYSPPYGSARDIINQAGFVASNVLKGDLQIIQYDQICHVKTPHTLLDVRNPEELEKLGTISGAINIPVDQLRQRLHELPTDKEVILFCQVGLRGNVAYRLLTQKGYRVRNLTGGFMTWKIAQ